METEIRGSCSALGGAFFALACALGCGGVAIGAAPAATNISASAVPAARAVRRRPDNTRAPRDEAPLLIPQTITMPLLTHTIAQVPAKLFASCQLGAGHANNFSGPFWMVRARRGLGDRQDFQGLRL